MTPHELAIKCAPMIADIGSAYYFVPNTLDAGKERGLGGYQFYFLGRGGVLGDVDPEVVTSAFGYFHPDLVTKIWNKARDTMDPREGARLHLACAAELARTKFADLDLAAFCVAAAAVNDAVNPAGLAQYAGVDAEPLPDDDAARAMQLCICLREARGSAHLAAVVTTGIDVAVAHYIRRPDFYETFGWSDTPSVRPEDRELLDRADALTDDMMETPFAALDPSGAEAMLRGLTEMTAALKAE